MYLKNSNFVVLLALALVVGFGASFLVGGLGTQSELTGGDIAKAARFINQKEDPAMDGIKEKLRNDKEFLDNTKSAMAFLQESMQILSELSEQTVATCEGIPEFESVMLDMKSINARSFNAASAMEKAEESLDRIANGGEAPEYEIYSNQAFAGYSKVEKQVNVGRRFYETAILYLDGKEGGQCDQIAELAAVWAAYCKQDAHLNSNNDGIRMASTDGNGKIDTTKLKIVIPVENTGSFSTTKIMDGIIGRIIKAVISRDEDVASNTFSVDDAFPGIGGLNDLS